LCLGIGAIISLSGPLWRRDSRRRRGTLGRLRGGLPVGPLLRGRLTGRIAGARLLVILHAACQAEGAEAEERKSDTPRT
jgi:hypothetical protein